MTEEQEVLEALGQHDWTYLEVGMLGSSPSWSQRLERRVCMGCGRVEYRSSADTWMHEWEPQALNAVYNFLEEAKDREKLEKSR